MTDSINIVGDQKKGFLMFIAYMQIIGIVLVVLGHSFHEFPDGHHGKTLLFYRMCYNFHMPLFMFVSGFLMVYSTFKKNRNYPSPLGFVRKKAKRLLIPYLVLTLVTYIPRASLSNLADDPMELSVKGAIESLYITSHLPIPFFWFLQSSFLLLTLIFTIVYISRCIKISLACIYGVILFVFALALFLEIPYEGIFGIKQMMRFGVYFVLGAIYCEFYEQINCRMPLDSGVSLIITFTVWLSLFLIGECSWIYTVASVFGIAMCICAAKLMVKHNIKFLNHLNGANYIIFLLSWYFNIATQQVLSYYIDIPWWIHTILSLAFGIYIPLFFYRYMLRNSQHQFSRVILFLLGHKAESHKT